MQEVSLAAAGEADIPAIAALADVVWNQHYPAIISQQQISYMLELMYSEESLRQQMKEKKHQFFFIVSPREKVGFISVTKEKNGGLFLNKFYIDQQKASKGVGSAAFKILLSELRPESITLTVNRQNYKAINFYFKNGFRIERVADFDIGNGYVMNDFVMAWKRNAGAGK